MISLHHENGRYPEVAGRFFDLSELDVFSCEDVNSLLYGNSWESVLVEDGSNALLHSYARCSIAGTGLYDVEPLIGYAGPIANTTQPEFLSAALTEYSSFCHQSNIVAELIRFNPMSRNHVPLIDLVSGLRVIEGKPIAYIRLSPDPEVILRTYRSDCRRCARKGLRLFQHRVADRSPESWLGFVDLYLHAMQTKNANSAWMFDRSFFERLRSAKRASLFETLDGDEVLSALIILAGRKTSYALIGANSEATSKHEPGASNSNFHCGAVHMATLGCSWLCLGGGNSDDPQDPLMRFKASFASEINSLPLGFFTHDESHLADLYAQAEAEDPGVASSRLFLRYRLAPSLSAGRMKPTIGQDGRVFEQPCPAEPSHAV